jgi:hypothetical protein
VLRRAVRRAALPAALALAVVSFGSAGPALAVEGETARSVSARFAALGLTQSGDDHDGIGGGLLVDLQRALSDTLWLRGAVSGAVISIDGEAGGLGTASFGLTWAVDVLKYVPYVGIGGGLLVAGGGALDAEVEPFIELGVGLDVIVSTRFSYGLDARFSSFVGNASVFLVGPRVSWRWGYF